MSQLLNGWRCTFCAGHGMRPTFHAWFVPQWARFDFIVTWKCEVTWYFDKHWGGNSWLLKVFIGPIKQYVLCIIIKFWTQWSRSFLICDSFVFCSYIWCHTYYWSTYLVCTFLVNIRIINRFIRKWLRHIYKKYASNH